MFSTLVLTLSFLAPVSESDKSDSKAPKDAPTAITESAPAAQESAPTTDQTPGKTAPPNTQDAGKKNAKEKKTEELELHPIEVSVISYTNEARKKYKLPPLEVDKDLMQTARKHCGWMTRNRIFQHGRYGVAENIAMGQRDGQAVMRAWMNSYGHRANILNPRHRRIGVSAYRSKSGRIYWCQQFRN